MILKITLPIPPRDLSPNSRAHWRKKAADTKAYKETAYLVTREKFSEEFREANWSDAELVMTFYFKTKHRRDRDNCIAWMKAGIDGIAKGMEIDDAGFHYHSPAIEHDKENPRVEIEVVSF